MGNPLALLRQADDIRSAINLATFRSPYITLGEHGISLGGYTVEELEQEERPTKLLPADHPAWREILPLWRLMGELEAAHKAIEPYLPLVAHRDHQLGPVVIHPACVHWRRYTGGVGECYVLTISRPLAESLNDILKAIRHDLAALLGKLEAELAEEELYRKELLMLAPGKLYDATIAWGSVVLRRGGVRMLSTPSFRTYGGGPEGFRLIIDGYDVLPSWPCVSFKARLTALREMEAVPAVVEALQQATPYVARCDFVLDLGFVEIMGRREGLDVTFREPIQTQSADKLAQRLAIEVPAAILAGGE